MKVKYSVIPFAPAFLAMLFFKLMSLVGADGNGRFMGMDNTTITYTVLGITLGLFAVCILINLFDRKTAPVYPVKKNAVAGIFAVFAGLTIMAYSITTAVDAWQAGANQEYKLLTTICAAFSVPAGISLALMSRIHFAGKSVVSSISMLYVFPSLWGCAELVNEFMQATKTSVSAKDLTRVFCFIFIALFFFSSSMVVSRIKGRNPVKGVFIYGLPMAAISLTFGIYELVALAQKSGVINSDLTQNLVISSSAAESSDLLNYSIALNAVMLIACAAYALVFIFELFCNTYTKDDIEIIGDLPDDEDEAPEEDNTDEAISKEDDFDLLFGAKNDDTAKASNSGFRKKAKLDFGFAAASSTEKKDNAKAAQKSDNKSKTKPVSGEFEDLVFSDKSREHNPHVKFDDDYYSSSSGLDDFIIGYSYDDGDDNKSKKFESRKSFKKQDKAERKAAKKQEAERKAAEKAEKSAKAENNAFAEKPEPKAEETKPQAAFGAKKEDKKPEKTAVQAPEVKKTADAVSESKTDNSVKVSQHSVDANLAENLRHGTQVSSTPVEKHNTPGINNNLALELKKAAELRKNPGAQKQVTETTDVLAREEANRAEEEKARRDEEARRTQEARIAEAARRAEQARLEKEARRAEEQAKAAEQSVVSQAAKQSEATHSNTLSDIDRLLKELEDKK